MIRQGREGGAGRDADPQVAAIMFFTRIDAVSVRSALALLLAIAVETISAFGLFAIMPRAGAATSSGAVEPDRHGTVTATMRDAGWRLLKAG